MLKIEPLKHASSISGEKSGLALDASDPATDKQYRAAYANMVRMVKKLYDSGIQIVAGTDDSNGYALDRELSLVDRTPQETTRDADCLEELK